MKTVTNTKVQVLRQGGLFIAYSHILDLSTTGKSETEALGRFQNVVEICTRAGIGKAEVCNKLTEMGWTQKQKRWTPPDTKAK